MSIKKALTLCTCFLLVITTTLSFTGCGGTSNGAAGSPTVLSSSTTSADGGNQSVNDDVTLRVLNWGNMEEEAIFNQAITRYESSHTGYNVEQTIVPVDSWTDFIQKWIAMNSSGDAPDLINIGLEGMQMAFANNLIESLDGYIADDSAMSGRMGDFAESLLAGATSDGQLFGIPNGTQTMVMYYNKALFDAAGVEYPKDGWTWADFRDKAEKLTGGEGDAKVYGYGLPLAYFQLTPWWVTNDAYPSTKDYSAPDLSNPQMVESLEFLAGLVNDGISPDPTGVDVYSQFAAGKLGMVGAGRWVLNGWIEGGLENFDCVAWPQNTKKSTVYGGAYWSIARNSDNKDAAYLLLSEFVSDETLTATASLGQQIPPMEKLAQDPAIMGTIPDSIGELWQAVISSTPVCAPTFFGELEPATLRAVENAIAGTASPGEALAAAQKEVESAVG